MTKIHLEDIRLYNNAGISFPVCQRNAKMLDLDKTGWTTAGNIEDVTCKLCVKLAPKYYPWAYSGTRSLEYRQARKLIQDEYGSSRNPLTPDVLLYGWIREPDIAYELTEGELLGEPLYGVSVAKRMPDGTTRRLFEPVSRVFHVRTTADAHIAWLRRNPPREEY